MAFNNRLYLLSVTYISGNLEFKVALRKETYKLTGGLLERQVTNIFKCFKCFRVHSTLEPEAALGEWDLRVAIDLLWPSADPQNADRVYIMNEIR